jgi:hypothetical protein
MGLSSILWMPRWWPWKVDCTDGSRASEVAAVVVSLFGHVDGMERMVRILVLAMLWLWQLPDHGSET